ncbi:hypothetical protein RCS94_09235 [Orbaceae bacterium ac157xtp]
MIPPSSYGALSATSANTIQGSRPGFTGQSGAKRLGFVVDGISYSEANDAYDAVRNPDKDKIISGVQKNFNAGLKLSDFTVTSLTASDFSPTADYADADGDEAHPTAAFSMSPRTFEWRDRTGGLISTTDYNKTLGCGSTLKTPLTLRITLPNVKVKSLYGNPNESIATSLVQEYKIGTATGICFAKPNAMIVEPAKTWFDPIMWLWNQGVTPHATKGGGYNSAQFDPAKGFKASLSPKFPTTGFPKASFTLIMTSNASDWIFSSNDSAVVVDTAGKVTLNSKPSGAVTIKAIYKNDTSQVHYYTFNPTSVWVVPKLNPANSNGSYTYAEAKTECGSESSIPSRAQLTNSPQKTVSAGALDRSNAYIRAVNGGVFGEWGYTSSVHYPNSQWKGNLYYWTRDEHSSGIQFGVDSTGGIVNYGGAVYVACLE